MNFKYVSMFFLVFLLCSEIHGQGQPTPSVDQLVKKMQELSKETERAKEEVNQLRQEEAKEKAERVIQTRLKLERQELEVRAAAIRADRRKQRELESLKPIVCSPELLETDELFSRIEPDLRPMIPVLSFECEEKSKVTLAAEKDALVAKIARANRRWHCRFFRIGCIGRK